MIIIGGGLAGLTAAVHLASENYRVLVFEKQQFPHHKVCGEYVSNEVLPYLKALNIPLSDLGAVAIDTLQISTVTGKSVESRLPLGGFGASRYTLDQLFYQQAISAGALFVFEQVTSVHFQNDMFEILTERDKSFVSKVAIGAYGKRNGLDKQLNRDFIHQKSPWLGVKAHYKHTSWPDNVVALHNFSGGYAGLSKTESGAVNFCYLASYESFKHEKNINDFNKKVLGKNPFLDSFLKEADPLFEQPMTIAQISFGARRCVEKHMLMCGDTAGMIHPLCGNGMAMAIHSAKIAAECIAVYLKDDNHKRSQMENAYKYRWNKVFKRRLWMGRQLQSLFLSEKWTHWTISAAVKSPKLLTALIRSTHGHPIKK